MYVFFLSQGVVLGQPDDCPDHVYQIMKSCWHQDASQRPNFTLMIAQLKQEVTSPTHSPDHPLPVHDKQSFYQNIGFSPEQFKGKLDIVQANNLRKEILESFSRNRFCLVCRNSKMTERKKKKKTQRTQFSKNLFCNF